MKKKNFIDASVIYVILTVCMLIFVFPLFYTISASFKTNSEILAHPEAVLPMKPTMDNYIQVWNSDVFNFKSMLSYSVYYTVVCVVVTLLSSCMGGYVFARGEFRGKAFWLAAFSMLMFFSMGSVAIYPTLKTLSFLHIPKSLHGLLFVKMFSVNIVNIYLVRSYVTSIPKEIDEAAQIDGCSFIGIFFRIIAPMLKPLMATLGILAFQASWNDYLLPMIFTLGTPNQRTLIVGLVALSKSGESAANWNLILAGTTVSLLPVLIAYCCANKYFVSGISAGAVKG